MLHSIETYSTAGGRGVRLKVKSRRPSGLLRRHNAVEAPGTAGRYDKRIRNARQIREQSSTAVCGPGAVDLRRLQQVKRRGRCNTHRKWDLNQSAAHYRGTEYDVVVA